MHVFCLALLVCIPIFLIRPLSSPHILDMPNKVLISADLVKCRTTSLWVSLTTILTVLYYLDFSLLIFDQVDFFASILISFTCLVVISAPLATSIAFFSFRLPLVRDFSFTESSLIPNTILSHSISSLSLNSHGFAICFSHVMN